MHPPLADQGAQGALLGVARGLAEQHPAPALHDVELLVRHLQHCAALVAAGGLVLGLGGLELGLQLVGGLVAGLLDLGLELVGLVAAPGHLSLELAEPPVLSGHGVGLLDQGGRGHLAGQGPLGQALAGLLAGGRGHAADAQEPARDLDLADGHGLDLGALGLAGGLLGVAGVAGVAAVAGLGVLVGHGVSSFRGCFQGSSCSACLGAAPDSARWRIVVVHGGEICQFLTKELVDCLGILSDSPKPFHGSERL